ncbi:uncharacterized protein LOC133379152 [Rhineura floridana]|uniref:uncharacterized protein LOC133379152 n=1 Tax=Rhineura floridana TaxID=261503 RepID=UPI002AC861C7|nr:uncharacterized protein LOC133379152 [Rhineura floridana]
MYYGDLAGRSLCSNSRGHVSARFPLRTAARVGRRGRGVAVIYRESLVFARPPLHRTQFVDCMYWRLGPKGSLGILLVYCPPRCTADSLAEVLEVVSAVRALSPELLVLGDFNLHAEAALIGAPRDFLETMASWELYLSNTGPTHVAGHALDLVFVLGEERSGLKLGVILATPVSWSDHYLVNMDFSLPCPLHRGEGPIKMVRPRRLMDPDGFLTVLGELEPAEGRLVETLVKEWNVGIIRALDRVAPKRPLPLNRTQLAPWYTPRLRSLRQEVRRLERRWRKSRSEDVRTQVRAAVAAYQVAIKVGKKAFFAASIASAECCPRRLFQVVPSLVGPVAQEPLEQSKASCDLLAKHFADKIEHLRSSIPCAVDTVDEPELASCMPVNWDRFRLLPSEEVDKVLSSVKPTTCLTDPCPSWLLVSCREKLGEGIKAVVNASLKEGVMPSAFKEAIVKPILKKPSLDPQVFDNFRPISNLPFLGKVIE